MDKEQIKLVVIVQCEFASKRCSGHACMRSFYERTGTFQNYPSTTMYLSLTCGGCCGKGLVAKLEHLTKMNLKKWQLQRNQVAIHLASCICKDNYHADVCPHLDYIKNILYIMSNLVKEKGTCRVPVQTAPPQAPSAKARILAAVSSVR